MSKDKKQLEQQVIVGTIELIEKISNDKTESITLENGRKFYRAESHVLKIIGEQPGIFSSEIARRFSVTRGAIQKTLGRLEERELIRKEVDAADKKRIQLYLTEEGRHALELLVQHQMRINAAFFTAISTMTAEELTAVNRFLTMTQSVMDDIQKAE